MLFLPVLLLVSSLQYCWAAVLRSTDVPTTLISRADSPPASDGRLVSLILYSQIATPQDVAGQGLMLKMVPVVLIAPDEANGIPGYLFDLATLKALPADSNLHVSIFQTARITVFPPNTQPAEMVRTRAGFCITKTDLGTTTLTEAEIINFDPTSSTAVSGLFADAINANPRLVPGVNDENRVIFQFLKRLFPNDIEPSTGFLSEAGRLYETVLRPLADGTAWNYQYGSKALVTIGDVWKMDMATGKYTGQQTLRVGNGLSNSAAAFTDILADIIDTNIEIEDNLIAIDATAGAPPETEVLGASVCMNPAGAGAKRGACQDLSLQTQKDTSMGRIGGADFSISRIVTVGAAAALGALFVILDIVAHNWVGLALGAVGIAALGAVDAALAEAGPIGWLIDIVITFLFLILPGIRQPPPAAPITNVTEILQWKFFGDKDHTGNEGCRQKTATNPNPNPACQALYGPNVLQMMFGWESFDAAAFLLQCNNGYAITIPDMAACFAVQSTASGKLVGASQYATINCNNRDAAQTLHGVAEGAFDPSLCQSPEFKFDRSKVTLNFATVVQNVNQTALNSSAPAAAIYNRIVPNNPTGDCAIFSDVSSGVPIQNLNIVISGVPVSIVCGITPSFNPAGNVTRLAISAPISAVSSNATSASNTTAIQNSSLTSTDGSAGLQGPTIPLIPWVPANATSAVCFTTAKNELCLFNGSYDAGMKDWGFSLGDTTNVSYASGATLTLDGNWYLGHGSSPFPIPPDYSESQPKPNESYPAGSSTISNIQAFMQDQKSGSKFSVHDPLDPGGICVFEGAQFTGGAACFLAPGAGNLSAPQLKGISSLTLHGGANVEMFAEYYGDATKQTYAHDIPDLTAVPLGTNGNFAKNIVAMAVYVPSSK